MNNGYFIRQGEILSDHGFDLTESLGLAFELKNGFVALVFDLKTQVLLC